MVIGGSSRGRRRVPRRGAASAAVQESLFEVQVRPERRFYRQMLDAVGRSEFGSDPLAAEAIVSRLFGTVWASQPPPRDGDTEEAFGLGLVEVARQHLRPTTVALLRTVAVVAPIREVREAAATAADRMTASGLPEPAWQPPVGAVTPVRCWAFEDVFGDAATVMCEFHYGPAARPTQRHGIVVQVDHALFSAATSAVLIDDVDPVIRDLGNQAQARDSIATLRQVEPGWAHGVLTRAFARTDLVDEVEVGPDFADVRALALARIHMRPASSAGLAVVPPPLTASVREALIDDFLGSVPANGLAGPAGVRAAAGLILDFIDSHSPGNPVRVGPATWDTFLFEWLPARPAGPDGPDPAALAALPSVVPVWSAWAARQARLPEHAQRQLAEAVRESLATIGTDTAD